MEFEGALIHEQGVRFAVVVVREAVLRDRRQVAEVSRRFSPAFGGVPVVLMAQNSRGVPTYFGRPDLARFLSRVPVQAIPWKRFTLN